MKIAGIYVETPFQLINAINIAKNFLKMDGCVLFLFEKMWQTDRKFQVSTSDPYIKGVYYIQSNKDVGRIKYHFWKIKGLLTGHNTDDYPIMCSYYKTKPIKMPKFSAIVCNKYDAHLADLYIRVYNYKLDVYIIEDGLGDYALDNSRFDLGYPKIFYWPEFYEKMHNQSILKAPTISLYDSEFIRIMNDIYSDSSKNEMENCKCVYFHQPYISEDKSIMKKIDEEENQIVQQLQNYFKEGFYIKLHPRDDLSLFPNCQKLNSNVPWEVMVLNKKNISDMLLVGGPSTTLVTPKITFDCEPYVLYLGVLFQYWKDFSTEDDGNNIDLLFNSIKQLYRNKEKFLIPESKIEVKNFINEIL